MNGGAFCDNVHQIVEAFSTALDAKNTCMRGHSERVADLSLLLARTLNLVPEEQSRIHIGAHLHDIGKIGIPDAILNKNGKLTETEFAVIRQHPGIGSDIVGRVRVLGGMTDIVRHHHERYDGMGYPDRLTGEKISLGARIVAAADAFDAMTGQRSYRLAMSVNDALAEMRRCRGTQFDARVVDALALMADQGEGPFGTGWYLSVEPEPLRPVAGFKQSGGW
ncbi:MAG TPA: HD-GYP domain-containing protein [Patescibacteria group bacterium]|nr:HD-GYP domain-containing protein [Patescibacteria group bacterium]